VRSVGARCIGSRVRRRRQPSRRRWLPLTRKTPYTHREQNWEAYQLKELKGLPPREPQVSVGTNQAAMTVTARQLGDGEALWFFQEDMGRLRERFAYELMVGRYE